VQPRQLLRQIPGVKLREPIDAALCCGSAGVYNMLQPDVADELGKQKVQNLLNTGADLITSANPGCTLQITKHLKLQGKEISVVHPMELLDYSIRGEKLEGNIKSPQAGSLGYTNKARLRGLIFRKIINSIR
jgi:glycolate oxidase iron-sulfur subunit